MDCNMIVDLMAFYLKPKMITFLIGLKKWKEKIKNNRFKICTQIKNV